MASSFLLKVCAAAVVCATQASATKAYQVTDVYDSTNFFEKFNFVSSTDPNGGYVSYQNQNNAKSLELVKHRGSEIYIGVDHTSNNYETDGSGRKSVRLESKTTYNNGLIIADFSHLPKPVCGSWPSFWLFGEPWPTKGEVDIYENWNDLTFNRHTAHVNAPSVVGECKIVSDDMASTIDSANCYDFATGQYEYQGCSASQQSDTFGSASGGVYAMEWTSEYIRMWDWTHDATPADILNGNPEPSVSTWGMPSYLIKECDIEKAFNDMKMVFSLDFCAVAGQTDKWGASCKASTTYDYCTNYVASQGADFEDVYFQVKNIKYYELAEDASQSTSTATTATTSSSSSSSSTTSSTLSLTTSSMFSNTSAISSAASVTSSYFFANTSTAALPTATSTIPDEEDDETCSDEEGDEDTATGHPAATYVSTADSHETPEMTTSTVYATSVYTVTSCAPTVTNCPAHHYVTTETISIGTTVCPVTPTGSVAQPTTAYASAAERYTTKTVVVTKIYTVTSCKPTVTGCPAGSVTTEVSTTTTVVPVGGGAPLTIGTPAGYSSVGNMLEDTAAVLETSILLPTAGQASKPAAVAATVSPAGGSNYAAGSGSGSGSGNAGSSSTSSTSTSNVEVIITATVIPITSVNTGYGYDATLLTTVSPAQSRGYSTSSVSSSSSTSTASSSSSSSSSSTGGISSVVEVGEGIKTEASVALMGVAAFFIFVM